MGEEECRCCDVEFIGGAIIMGCCQRLLCDDCMFEGDGRRKAMLNACPFCRAPITKEGITRIDLGADAQLTEIIDDDGIESALFGDERKLETESAEAAAAAMPGPPPAGAGGAGGPALPDIPAGFDARLRGLLAHVQGRDDIERYIKRDAGVVADLATPNIIDGSEDIEPPAHAPRRYLIFVLAPELVGKVVDSLSDIGQVPCVRQIAGTFVAKARAKREFLSSPVDSALVVAASTDCGGMNLPQVTDLIILGRLVNPALRGQAISRAQRVGRTANLRLLQIWTDAEEGLAAE
jgi:hypothetical protein